MIWIIKEHDVPFLCTLNRIKSGILSQLLMILHDIIHFYTNLFKILPPKTV
jgi:hypothetical protein